MIDSELDFVIKEAIKKSGPICFARFMEMALYHPELGYYMRNADKIGKSGDYYTSSNVSNILGIVLGKYIKKIKEALDASLFYILEYGSGTGQLAKDILDYLNVNDSLKDIKYISIENSPYHKTIQNNLLIGYKNAIYFSDSGVLSDEKANGIVLSNELLDALPVHRIVKVNDIFKEIYISVNDNGFCEEYGDHCCKELNEYIEKYIKNPDINEIEINLSAKDWLKEVSKRLNKGQIITIDYGYTEKELNSGFYNDGTLVSYKKHLLNDNLLSDTGEKDITSHVNFSSIIDCGDEFGLKNIYYGTLSDFLFTNGLSDVLEEINSLNLTSIERFNRIGQIKSIISPNGFGERFKVLVQEKV